MRLPAIPDQSREVRGLEYLKLLFLEGGKMRFILGAGIEFSDFFFFWGGGMSEYLTQCDCNTLYIKAEGRFFV